MNAGTPRYSLSEMAYQRILGAIIEGRFPVGTRLPTEMELARENGISRPVLRAALARLRQDGIVAARQGSGNFVLRQPHQTVLRLAELSQIADIQDCFKFRIGVEGEAAYYAALNRDAAAMTAIDRAFAALEHAAQTAAIGVDDDFGFHLSIAHASANPYFISALASVRDHIVFGINLTRNLSLRRTHERAMLVQSEHRAIRDAIADQAADRAREAMRQHLEAARRRVFEGDVQDASAQRRARAGQPAAATTE